MKINDNPVWRLFSTVRIAILIISIIAATSILGTIFPQGEHFSFYVERYGLQFAMILEILDINDMYYSFWFKALLILLCINLIICTYTRLPAVFKILRHDNFDIKKKNWVNKQSIILHSISENNIAVDNVTETLKKTKKTFRSKKIGDDHLFFYETSKWSRLGAYIVHLSILVIVLGAIVGNYFGFKAFVMLPEGQSTKTVYDQKNSESIPLPFELICENFNLEYYENGTPREYKSNLIVLEGTEEVVKKSITVNNPLKYKGITFYQASYQPINGEYTVDILQQSKLDQNSINGKIFSKPSREAVWEEGGASFEIVASSNDGHGHGPYKIKFDDTDNKPIYFSAQDNSPYTFDRNSASYSFTINQRYATGLQVAKDPGVWLVYFGSALMLLGLYAAFFMSHQRIWVVVEKENNKTVVHIYGNTNKNKIQLNKTKETIASMLLAAEPIEFRRI
jgi:cytochrome c biogenesis protein